jgi:hypothetical protein
VRSGIANARRAVVALVGVAVLAAASLVAAPRASAATCWQRVIVDWRDGRINGKYSSACLHAALRNLPEDLRVYGSAEEDITRALTRAVDVRPHQVLAATATRTRTQTPRRAGTSASTPASKKTRSLAGRSAAKPRAVAASPATGEGRDGVFVPAIAAAALGLVALAAAAVAWRTRRRRVRRAL